MCSRVLVMYAGEVVEEGSPADLLSDPRHPYTWALLHAAPRLDEAGRRRSAADNDRGPAARPARLARRLPFPRALSLRGDACAEHPALLPVGPDALARCWVTQRATRCGRPPCRTHVRPARARRGRSRRAAAGGRRPGAAFPAAARRVSGPAARAAGAGRRRSAGVPRRDRGPGRRVRFRQVDAGAPGDAAGHADRGHDPCSTARTSRTRRRQRSGRCGGACR